MNAENRRYRRIKTSEKVPKNNSNRTGVTKPTLPMLTSSLKTN